jgi:hypothetical protein
VLHLAYDIPTPPNSSTVFSLLIGTDGVNGSRGPGWWRYETGTSASTAGLSTSAVNSFFSTATGFSPVEDDRFILVNTSDSATAYLYSSSSTWVAQPAFLDGDLLVSGTITGGKLAATSIITNSAQFDNAVITGAKIGNLQVDTLQIADQAVSSTGADSGTATASSSTYVDVASLVLSTDGGQSTVNAGGVMSFGSSGQGSNATGHWRILQDSTVLASGSASGESTSIGFAQLLVVTAPTGNTTYKIQGATTGGSSFTNVGFTASLVVTELKK